MQPFYQAHDRAAVTLAGEFGVTQTAAKDLMKETYRTAHNRSLYEDGTATEEACHKPVREAEMAAQSRETANQQPEPVLQLIP